MASAATKFPFFSANTFGTLKITGSHCGRTLSESLSNDSMVPHLYNEYKDWIKAANPFPTVKAELENLSKYRTYFRDLVLPDPNTPIGRFSAFLRIVASPGQPGLAIRKRAKSPKL